MAIAKQIRILLVDDDAMVRQGLRSALQAYSNIEVVGEAATGEAAVLGAAQHQPAVVVMDINMSTMDGITATRLIKTQLPEMVVLGLSVDPKDYLVYAMEKAGAFEVLKKDNAATDLYAAIQRAVAAVRPGLILEDASISKQPLPESKQSDNPAPAEPLSINDKWTEPLD